MKTSGSILISLPLDLLFEILSHLEPLDLLCLIRTSKNIRTLLLNPGLMRYAWKRSFANIPLFHPSFPVLPPSQSVGVHGGMSEPAYASLIFDRHCMVCYNESPTGYLSWSQWQARLRVCDTCICSGPLFVSKSEEPVSTILATFDRWRNTAQLDTECIGILTDADILYVCKDDQENEFFPRKIVESMASKLRNLPPSPRTDEISSFLRTEKRVFDETDEMAVTLRSFVCAETGSRWDQIDKENNALSHARYQHILTLLEDVKCFATPYPEIWKEHIQWCPQVWQPKRLTLQEWNKIRPEVIKYINTAVMLRL